jgi:hypothetical protein
MSSFWDRVKPWDCVCGQKNISANRGDCPKCHTPRAGTAAAVLEASVGQTTRIYEGEQALQAGIAEMARQGWRVASQSAYQPPAGVGRIVALGWAAKLAQPAIKFSVVFERIPTA